MDTIYKFKDGDFRFYSAHYGSWNNDRIIIFRVRMDSNPKKRAEEKSIKYYDLILKATDEEINLWLKTHPDYKILERI